MDFNNFTMLVKNNFKSSDDLTIDRYKATVFYEEKFEMKWLATKLKMFSYVAYLPEISRIDIEHYSGVCTSEALQKYSGLPRGFQNGVGSFNVLVSGKIKPQAIDFVMTRPKKHFAAFEMPIIVDLTDGRIYYYMQTPMWGAIYYKFFREYINKNFHVPF